MWEDLGFYGDDGVFHLHGVTGPDEYTTVVNDNAFTNLMARLNLNYAVAALRRLEASDPRRYAALCLELGSTQPSPRRGNAPRLPCTSRTTRARGITPQDDTFLSREVWDLDAHTAGQVPAPAALPPARRSTATRCSSRPTW